MIEKLTNCPQCAGILNEAGRCEFCGSKVYDFLNIDFSANRYRPSAKTYIRIKDSRGIILAPVIVDCATIETKYTPEVLYGDNTPLYFASRPNISIETTFNVIGDIIRIDTDEEE